MRTLVILFASLVPALAAAQPLVVVDPGHGGTDPGAVGCSLEEANVVLDTGQRLGVLLEAAGVRVALTRDDDTYVGLSARASFANSRGATGFVSIHSNANSGTPATGSETFVYTGSTGRTRELGQEIQNAILAAWMLRDRGLKEGNFAVLRETTMPAALGELAFTNRCDPDAALLGDPAARQRMAEHQRDAILRWLGIDPTTPAMGTLRGVVFEDQGVGPEDTTVRLPGASVRVVETGATATAGDPGADWSFDLPAGTYTVEASAAGHVSGTRSCMLASGAETWCSIGLLREGSATPDAGPAADTDAGPASESDAAPPKPRDHSLDAGCNASRSRGAPAPLALALLLLLAVLVSGRGRRASPFGPLLMVGLGSLIGCADEDERGSRVAVREPGELRVELGEAREWLAPDRASPQVSPDGTRVAISAADHRALFVLDLAPGGAWREVCRTARCGWEPRWQDGGAAIAFRTEGQSGTAVPAAAVTPALTPVPVRVGIRGTHVWTDDDDRVLLRAGGHTRVISSPGDRGMMPMLAADARHAVWWSLAEGIVVHRTDGPDGGTTMYLGPGGHPRIDPSGRWLVFERTEDDGHAITHGDLAIADLHAPRPTPATLVGSIDRIERMPSLSRIDASGRGVLAYLAEDTLIVREIHVRASILRP